MGFITAAHIPLDPACGYDSQPPHVYHLSTVKMTEQNVLTFAWAIIDIINAPQNFKASFRS